MVDPIPSKPSPRSSRSKYLWPTLLIPLGLLLLITPGPPTFRGPLAAVFLAGMLWTFGGFLVRQWRRANLIVRCSASGILLIMVVVIGVVVARHLQAERHAQAMREFGAEIAVVEPALLDPHVGWVRFAPKMGDSDLAAFVQMEGAEHVTTLMLERTKLTDAGLANLVSLPKLESLSLERTRVTDAGMAHIGKLPALRHLNLNFTQVTDAGLKHLKGLRLNSLWRYGTKISDEAVKELRLGPTVDVYLGPR